MKTFIKYQNLFVTTLVVLMFTSSCERGQEDMPAEAMQGIALQDMLAEEEYWEGNKLEYQDNFFTNDQNLFTIKDSNKTYSGVIKVRSRKGTIAMLESYASGLKDGDFFEYHDNGKLKSKKQFKMGMRHGYFYQWLNDGTIYSRKYFQDDLEDFGRFEEIWIDFLGYRRDLTRLHARTHARPNNF